MKMRVYLKKEEFVIEIKKSSIKYFIFFYTFLYFILLYLPFIYEVGGVVQYENLVTHPGTWFLGITIQAIP